MTHQVLRGLVLQFWEHTNVLPWEASPVALIRTIDRHDQADLWTRGLLLEDAAWRFSPPSYRRRYYDSKDPALTERFSETVRKLTADDFKHNPGIMSAIPLEAVNLILRPGAIIDEMEQWLKEGLAKGKFAAYGDCAPVNANSVPGLIPSEYFRGAKIDWGASSLSIGKSEFIAIRVFKPNWVNASVVSVAGDGKKRKMGRPSSRSEILAVLPEYFERRHFPKEYSKNILEDIRQLVLTKNPNRQGPEKSKGLSSQVIASCCREFELGRRSAPKL